MKYRPCIDIHNGVVKQIVGGTLADDEKDLIVNFEAPYRPAYYALKFRDDELTGGHVIMLKPDPLNAAGTLDALSAWPGAFHVGGGMNADNAFGWLDRGAGAIIMTSYVFRNGQINMDNLQKAVKAVGKDKLVLDLSCRKRDGRYYIVTDRWQKFTDVEVNETNLDFLSKYCFEFLVHGADVEGCSKGIETDLVQILGEWDGIQVTYAGGITTVEDIKLIEEFSNGRLDFTVGSALDLYGGKGIAYSDLVAFNKAQRASKEESYSKG